MKSEGDKMRFDTWTKEQKQELDLDYKKRFGGQVRAMKKLYHTDSDPVLLKELLDNVGNATFQALEYKDTYAVEALIERMFLSALQYDVYLYYVEELKEYQCDLYFYNDYDAMELNELSINSSQDMTKLIEMILYIGRYYLAITAIDEDAEKHLNEYDFLSGFDIYVFEIDEYGLSHKRLKH